MRSGQHNVCQMKNSSETCPRNVATKTRIAFLSMYYFGFAVYFPFNSVLKSKKFFPRLLRGAFQNTFQIYFVATFCLSDSLALTVYQVFGIDRLLCMQTRILVGFSCYICAFAATMLLNFLCLPGDVHLMLVCIVLGFAGASAALAQKSFYSLLPKLSLKHSQAYFCGQGIAGVISAAVGLLSANLNLVDDSDKVGPSVYFGSTLLFIFLAIVLFVAFSRSAEFQETECPRRKPGPDQLRHGSVAVLKQIKGYAFLVFANFAITMALVNYFYIVQPLSAMAFVQKNMAGICFLVFDLGDLAGKTVGGMESCRVTSLLRTENCFSTLAVLVVGRVLFWPVFLLANIAGGRSFFGSDSINDTALLAAVFLFAFLKGYLAISLMVVAPRSICSTKSDRNTSDGAGTTCDQSCLPDGYRRISDNDSDDDKQLREAAGSLLSVFLMWGLAIGSATGFILRIFHGQNPFQ